MLCKEFRFVCLFHSIAFNEFFFFVSFVCVIEFIYIYFFTCEIDLAIKVTFMFTTRCVNDFFSLEGGVQLIVL